MKPRLRLTRHLGAAANAEPAARAEDWLRGRADLLIAGMGGRVPVVVQLGVLAHADLGRLADLGRHSRRGRRTAGAVGEQCLDVGLGDPPGHAQQAAKAGRLEREQRVAAAWAGEAADLGVGCSLVDVLPALEGGDSTYAAEEATR
jgi:hypothetical protein